ncbi:hypothetical protein [Hufsiella ginkgonis]|uniref:hypothetical protein n=1 Tax=Hufsiella ginkgonis TaxID=2695274 RepID=UPI001F3189C6|nr:hypothetical protein [Hufsiella ginkgonis]
MAVGAALTQGGFTPGDLTTDALLDLDMASLRVTRIHLMLKASSIAGVDEAHFRP